MYFTSGGDRAFESLMQGKPGFDHYDSGDAGAPEDCGDCRFYRPDWKYQFCVYAECPYQPGKLTALDAVKFRVKGVDDEMAVFRVEKNRGYTVMSNHHLRNKDLSLKAKGLLSQKKPFQSWELSNNNAEIHRVRQRIESLTRAKETVYVGWEFDGGHVEANREQSRLQVVFEDKPDAYARQQLKEHGFRWAPSVGAWQRLLNGNAYYAADRIPSIQPLTGEKPTELQRNSIREQQAQMAQAQAEPEEYVYRVHAATRSESPENLYLLQAYVPQEDGTVKIGAVLYAGTEEKTIPPSSPSAPGPRLRPGRARYPARSWLPARHKGTAPAPAPPTGRTGYSPGSSVFCARPHSPGCGQGCSVSFGSRDPSLLKWLVIANLYPKKTGVMPPSISAIRRYRSPGADPRPAGPDPAAYRGSRSQRCH